MGEALRWWSTCWMSCVIKTVESFPQMETGMLLFSDNLGCFDDWAPRRDPRRDYIEIVTIGPVCDRTCS